MKFWAFPFMLGCMMLSGCAGLTTEWVLQMHYYTPPSGPLPGATTPPAVTPKVGSAE